MATAVLVTGVSRYLGGRFARLLTAHPAIDRVIGVDVVPPPHAIGGAEFVRADIRNPMIGKIIAQADVDTVVHMNVIATPMSAGGRVSKKEINVIGTMQLLAACQKAPGHPPAGREVLRRRLRLLAARPRDVHRGHGPQGAAAGRVRQGLGRGRGLRPRVLPAAARRRDLDAAARQHHRPGHQDQPDRLLHPAGHPGAVRLRRPAAVRPRGRRAAGAAAGHDRQPRSASSTSPGTASSPSSRPPAWPGARRCPVPMAATGLLGQFVRRSGLADFSAGPDAVPRLRPGPGHHPDARRRWTSSRGSPPARRSRTSSPRPAPDCRARRSSAASSTVWPARPPASSPTRCPRQGAPDGRSRRRADPRRFRARQGRRTARRRRARGRCRPSQRRAGQAPPYAAAQRPRRQ